MAHKVAGMKEKAAFAEDICALLKISIEGVASVYVQLDLNDDAASYVRVTYARRQDCFQRPGHVVVRDVKKRKGDLSHDEVYAVLKKHFKIPTPIYKLAVDVTTDEFVRFAASGYLEKAD